MWTSAPESRPLPPTLSAVSSRILMICILNFTSSASRTRHLSFQSSWPMASSPSAMLVWKTHTEDAVVARQYCGNTSTQLRFKVQNFLHKLGVDKPRRSDLRRAELRSETPLASSWHHILWLNRLTSKINGFLCKWLSQPQTK